ncbi:Serine proteases trypsin domain [Trinorchestia longiramus]|nr:Serine proteases trypsin domain [Trinorchestia longiramus]
MRPSHRRKLLAVVIYIFLTTGTETRHPDQKSDQHYKYVKNNKETLNHEQVPNITESNSSSSVDPRSAGKIHLSQASGTSEFRNMNENDVSIRDSRSLGYRTGGYPKFPMNEAYSVSSGANYMRSTTKECGERSVFHDLEKKTLQPSGRIIGGSPVPYGAYPWTANMELKYGEQSHHHCGGAIIGPHHVLTAAHCVKGFKTSEFSIKVGDDSRSTPDENEQTFDIDKWIIHPMFQKGGAYSNDVAVIKIKSVKGIKQSATVAAACLPTRLTPYTHGTWCYVSGWGVTNTADYEHKPDRLQAASIPLLAAEVCERETVHGKIQFGPGMVCAGYLQGTVDACGGDSGGPLVCEVNGSFNVLGIVSWGSSCAKPNKPGVYTKVQYYLDWINDAVEKLNGDSYDGNIRVNRLEQKSLPCFLAPKILLTLGKRARYARFFYQTFMDKSLNWHKKSNSARFSVRSSLGMLPLRASTRQFTWSLRRQYRSYDSR